MVGRDEAVGDRLESHEEVRVRKVGELKADSAGGLHYEARREIEGCGQHAARRRHLETRRDGIPMRRSSDHDL